MPLLTNESFVRDLKKKSRHSTGGEGWCHGVPNGRGSQGQGHESISEGKRAKRDEDRGSSFVLMNGFAESDDVPWTYLVHRNLESVKYCLVGTGNG